MSSNSPIWHRVVISPDDSIYHSVEVINNGEIQIALVVDEKKHLIGTITDGDIRRAILNQIDLSEPAQKIMCPKPIMIEEGAPTQQMLSMMRAQDVQHLPIVSKEGKLTGLETLKELLIASHKNNTVVLMAGGLGSRLKERTKNTPKPLLNIGGKPILETILENFIEYGFSNFVISIRYLSEKIKEHFGDGKKWGVTIQYIEEKEPLGTAGALSLLKEKPTAPFFVMNGDVLTKVNFRQLLRFHEEHQSNATMCVRGFEHQVPYGVVETKGVNITALEEKPIKSIMVNAGIYVLNPDTLDHIPHNSFFDMPSLFETLMTMKKNTVAFPVHEYWLDVGKPDDFEIAMSDYETIFKP